LWVKFFDNGHPVHQSTGTSDPQQAAEFLRQRLAEVAKGEYQPPTYLTVSELVEDVFADYAANSRRSLGHAKRRWRLHLEPVFGHLKPNQVRRAQLVAYRQKRIGEGANVASINREMSLLGRAFNLGLENEKIKAVPKFPRYSEHANIRKGFAEPEQIRRILECGPKQAWFPALVEVARTFAWRRSELVGSMKVNQVDFLRRTVRLDTSKNGKGREVTMSDEVYRLLMECCRGKSQNDYVFTWPDGNPVREFRQAWSVACTRAALGRRFLPLPRRANAGRSTAIAAGASSTAASCCMTFAAVVPVLCAVPV
jgi:integrase